MDYMAKIFNYILDESDRQVVVLPTTAEMNLATVENDYGAAVASIYQLERQSGSKATTIKELHRRGP